MSDPKLWKNRGGSIDVGRRCHVMGILNVTPDSFSDGGSFLDVDAAVEHGLAMAADGADIIDIGGESTRPGAEPVPAEAEIARVVPVILRLADQVDIPISIDTMKASVAEAAIEAGAAIINDVSAMGADPGMSEVAARTGAGVVLMHMRGEPRTMQKDPRYTDVVSEVSSFLTAAADRAVAAGVDPQAIMVDPGIGFGKMVEHNLALLGSVGTLASGRYPVLVGPSRKSFIGAVLDVEVDERLEGTAAAVAWCVAKGVAVVRVHDVKQMVRVVKMIEAIAGSR